MSSDSKYKGTDEIDEEIYKLLEENAKNFKKKYDLTDEQAYEVAGRVFLHCYEKIQEIKKMGIDPEKQPVDIIGMGFEEPEEVLKFIEDVVKEVKEGKKGYVC
ncbi:MAG: hypothetical protein QXP39_02975 [Candidatus Aenigmatarchaeota archaeon]